MRLEPAKGFEAISESGVKRPRVGCSSDMRSDDLVGCRCVSEQATTACLPLNTLGVGHVYLVLIYGDQETTTNSRHRALEQRTVLGGQSMGHVIQCAP
jgi:hypothetical protein